MSAYSFSAAPHETDPTDVVTNFGAHATKNTLSGAAVGAGVGGALGAIASAPLAHIDSKGVAKTLKHTGLWSLGAGAVGLGVGAAAGYKNTQMKRDAVRRAYGYQDPFETTKFASVDEAYNAGRAFALETLKA